MIRAPVSYMRALIRDYSPYTPAMTACLAYTINGLQLDRQDTGGDFWLLEGTEYAPAVTMRRSVVEVPGQHGEIPMWDDPMSSMTVALRVRATGGSTDELRQRWNILTGVLGVGTNQPVELRRHRETAIDFAEAQLVSTTVPDFTAVRNFLDVTILLSVPAGRWYSEDFIEEELSIPGAEQSSAIALASSMPVTDLMIRILGPLSTVSITDNISETGISWGGAVNVPAGQYLLISLNTMEAFIRLDDAWEASGTNVSSTLAFTGNGPLTLTTRITGPVLDQESSVTVTASGHSGATELWFRARSATV